MVVAGIDHHPGASRSMGASVGGALLGAGAGGWVATCGPVLGAPPPRLAVTSAVTAAAAATPVETVMTRRRRRSRWPSVRAAVGQPVGGGEVVHRPVEALAQVGAVVEIGHEVLPL